MSAGASSAYSATGSVSGGTGATAGAVGESGGFGSGSSAGMAGHCDPAEVNVGRRCPCPPGAAECTGNSSQVCGQDGQWGNLAACAAGQTCLEAIGCAAIASCGSGGPGRSDCGPNNESCCTSLEVSGGTYYRTYDGDGFGMPPADGGPTGEADPATVSTFRLDKYLVTVGRFRQFVNAVLPADGGTGWLPSPGSGKHTYLNGGNGLNATGGGYEPGWVETDDENIAPTDTNLACDGTFATWTHSAGIQENLPINCVNWWESYAFCIWDGGFLPSEAEFEYAAAGGSQQREYPWGSTAPGTACPGTGCQYAIYNCDYPSGTEVCVGVANIAPVGTATLGVALWGQLDLVGDVWEWNLDWWAPYANCTDCADVTAASYRVQRGSYFGFLVALPPFRGADTPASRESYNGFRCSRAP